MRRILALLFVLFMIAVAMSIWTSRANSTELAIPLPLPRHAPTVELPPVVVTTPAPAKVPFYCRVLLRFERSCSGVKLAAKSLGEGHALHLATRCGATSEEIVQAKACLQK